MELLRPNRELKVFRVLAVNEELPPKVISEELTPQSNKWSLSQILFIFMTFESPDVIKVSAALSSVTTLEPFESVSSVSVPYPFSAGIKGKA